MPEQSRPGRMEPGDRIEAGWLRKVADAVVQRISIVGGRVSRRGTSIQIEVDQTPQGAHPGYWVKITGATSATEYTGRVQKPDGSGGLQDSGRTITGQLVAVDKVEGLRLDGTLIVWARRNGRDTTADEPRYIFDYPRTQKAIINSSTEISADPPRHTYNCIWADYGSAGGYGAWSQSGDPLGGFTVYNKWEDVDRSGTLSLDTDGDGTDEARWAPLFDGYPINVWWEQYDDGSGGDWWTDVPLQIEGNCSGFGS